MQTTTKGDLTEEIKVCPDCQSEYQKKEFHNKIYWVVSCDCQEKKEKAIEEQKRILCKKNSYYKIGIPKRFINASFENINLEGMNKGIYQKVIEWTEGEKDKGLFLFGLYGTGKTYLACCIAYKLYFELDRYVQFYSVPALLEKARRSFNSNPENEIINPMDELIESPPQFLILDDIGKEKSSEWVREQLYILINQRYENLLPVIFTSNCNAKDLSNNLGEAIISRIYEMCDIYTLKGIDRRKPEKST